MHQTFDSSVPIAQQLKRIVKSHTGRKHHHRIGPGKVHKRVSAISNHKGKRYTDAVHAYWNGQRDTHP